MRCQCARGLLHAVRAQQRDNLERGRTDKQTSQMSLCLLYKSVEIVLFRVCVCVEREKGGREREGEREIAAVSQA